MTTLTDDQMMSGGAQPVAAAPMPPDPTKGLTDDQMMSGNAVSDVHEPGRAALNGLTFGLGPRVMATGRSLMGEPYDTAKTDEYAKLEGYKKAHPYEALGFETAGAVPTFFVPGVGEALGTARVAQAGNLAREGVQATQGLSAAARVQRAAGLGAEIGIIGGEVGAMGAKTAAINSALYDPTDWTDPLHHLTEAAKAAPLGYVAGRVTNRVGSALGEFAGNVADAARLGSNARATALREINERMGESGRTVEQATTELLPQNVRASIADPGKEAILTSYHDALAAGGTDRQATVAAQQAYRATAPQWRGQNLAASTMDGHVTEVVNAYHQTNATPMLASEVLHGVDNIAKGGVGSLAAEVMNSASGGRSALANAVQERQEGAIGRTRDLIQDTFGRPTTGPGRFDVADYTGTQRAIQQTSREMANVAYGEARQNAQPFQLGGIIDGLDRRSQLMAGNPRRALQSAVTDMRQWWTSMEGQPPAVMLNSYRQARSAMTEDMMALRQAGQRESAAQLMRMKSAMDRVVRGRNPDWWAANNQTATTFQLDRAADMGRTLPFKEGPRVQEAKDWAQAATAPERDMFRAGIGRRALDEIAPLGDTHDVSKVFLKGGSDQLDEGVRGIVGAALPQPDAERFINQMIRERTANRTFGMDKGAQTASLLAGEKRRNRIMNAALTVMHGLDPIHILRSIGELALSRAGTARDAEIGRMLAISTDNPAAMLRLLHEIASVSPEHDAGLAPLIRQVTGLAQRSAVPALAGTSTEGVSPDTKRRLGLAAPPSSYHQRAFASPPGQ